MRHRNTWWLMIISAILFSGAAVAALPPSKLGQFILKEWSSNEALKRSLREADLVKTDVTDAKLMTVFEKVRREHSALSWWGKRFNTPHERVRVLLEPYLTDKGRGWAIPGESLDLPDK